MGRAGNERKKRTQEELESEIFQFDAYETPPWVVRALLEREPRIAFAKKVGDFCCGPGVISREVTHWWPEYFVGENAKRDLQLVKENWNNLFDLEGGKFRRPRRLFAYDLRKGPHIFGVGGVDFLSDHFDPNTFDSSCDNPPFKETNRFIERLAEVTKPGGLFAIFQRVQLKEGSDRYRDIWSKKWLLRYHQFSSRVNCYPEGQVDHRVSGQFAFGWYVFEPGHCGRYEGDFINKTFRDYGHGALLPQQVGLCEFCKFSKFGRDLGVCVPEVATKKKKSDKPQLTRPMLEWLREFSPNKEYPGCGAGLELDKLCANWKPILRKAV